jgi:hypothetical protein
MMWLPVQRQMFSAISSRPTYTGAPWSSNSLYEVHESSTHIYTLIRILRLSLVPIYHLLFAQRQPVSAAFLATLPSARYIPRRFLDTTHAIAAVTQEAWRDARLPPAVGGQAEGSGLPKGAEPRRRSRRRQLQREGLCQR